MQHAPNLFAEIGRRFRLRCGQVISASRRLALEQVSDRADFISHVNPGPVLPAAANRAARKEAIRQSNERQDTALRTEDQSGANNDLANAG